MPDAVQVPLVLSFAAEGFGFQDARTAQPDTRLTGLEVWREIMLLELHPLRPGVELCRATTKPDNGCDPSLGVLNLVVSDVDGAVGMFNLYNIAFESRGVTRSVITATPAPGWRPNDSWGRVMVWLLENEIQTEEGTLDLVQWDYQTTPGQEWNRDRAATDAVQALRDAGHEVVERDGVPLRTRRAA